MMAALAHLGLEAAAKKSSGSSATLLIFLVVGAAFYFFFFRPQQRKAKALRQQGKTFDVGDEVLTAGGLVGHVLDIDGDRVTLETSVGASFVVLKQYVIRTIEEPVPSTEESDEGYEPDHEAQDEADETDDATDHEPDHETDDGQATPTEKETDEVTATEPTPNGAGTLGESTTDKFWLASDDSEQLPGAEGPGTAGGSRRSSRRKRRSAGGTSAGPSGPDSPSST
ncbi:MAG: preprotein translocase subunit YajC [Acidimicrobiales bacterium]